ncbi:tetratricopeptide repeat protein [Azospirillum halopraeferens]|uniref:tetratricopeptide repeat protein n=1 Tax=Azospirillum halopraeferens TaxID=34010 RepID=UPI0003FA6FD2|nr:glycosyltransferase family 41 protein [Azospirillum halopraeferens]
MAGIGEALLAALDLLEAGRLGEAEALCGRILDADPAQPDAWHLAGIAAARDGRPEAACDRFAAAIRLAPERTDLRLNHAAALAALSRPRVPALRRVLALEPNRPDVWHALAEAAAREEGPGAAVTPWAALAGLEPASAGVRYNLGVTLHAAGRTADAIDAYSDAVRRDPGLTEAHFNRANALRDLGRPGRAAAAYRAALAADPANAAAARNLGLLLLPADPAAAAAAFGMAAGMTPDRPAAALDHAAALIAAERPGPALAVLDAALAGNPTLAEGHNGRALALRALGRDGDAGAALARALAADPELAEAWINRAQALRDRGRPGAAATAARRALRLRPGSVAALGVLAQARHDAGRPEEAVALLRRAMAITPALPRERHADALLFLQSVPDADPGAVLAEHRRWARLHAPPPLPAPRSRWVPGRPLRVGYLSADFCSHSVASFFEPLLEAHDRGAVHPVCYSAVRRPDATTARLRAHAAGWRDVAGLGDAALADLIRADAIDVLVDLGGHTGGSRLAVLARRPAAVCLTAIGYPGTTGLPLDGRLTDPVIEPPGAEAWSSEPLIRLPGGFLCYRPPDGAPEPRAARPEGPIVFGSFNALGKLTPAVVAVWAAILADVPGSRLMLKSRALGDPAVIADLRARFAAAGVAADRLDPVAWTPDRAAHLALYERIDVGLDPFPYTGTTTTCEALWMGVPVVTLAGDRHAARVGAALLTRVGLPDLVATDPEGYRRTAVALAADTGRLADLRTELRTRLRHGPLGDARALAAAVEAAYRALLADPRRP